MSKRDNMAPARKIKIAGRLILLAGSALLLATLVDAQVPEAPRPESAPSAKEQAPEPAAETAPASESASASSSREEASEPAPSVQPAATPESAASQAAPAAVPRTLIPAPSESDLEKLRGDDSTDPNDNLIDWYTLGATKINRRSAPDYPAELAALDGKTARIRAFMHPYDDLVSMKHFMLMPTPGGCFFCQPASPKMVVLIRQAGDGEHPYNLKPLEVEGTLKLWKRDSDDPAHKSFLYVLDNAIVREVDLTALRSKRKSEIDAARAQEAVAAAAEAAAARSQAPAP